MAAASAVPPRAASARSSVRVCTTTVCLGTRSSSSSSVVRTMGSERNRRWCGAAKQAVPWPEGSCLMVGHEAADPVGGSREDS